MEEFRYEAIILAATPTTTNPVNCVMRLLSIRFYVDALTAKKLGMELPPKPPRRWGVPEIRGLACLTFTLAATLLLSGCALRHPVRTFHTVQRKWVASEETYDRWWYGSGPGKACLEQGHTEQECDPNWKPEEKK